jgi:hypothetical protein
MRAMSASRAHRMPVRLTRILAARTRFAQALAWRPHLARQVLARLALALMVLAAQQGALLHALGHGFEALKQGTGQQSQDHRHDCCAAFHGLDHASTQTVSLPPAVSTAAARVAQTARESLPTLRLHFQSRAPPAFS